MPTTVPAEPHGAFVAQGPARAQPGRSRSRSTSAGLFLVKVMWVLMVFEVDQFLTAKTGAPFNRIPTLVAPVLAFVTLFHGKKKMIYWPILLFLALHLGASLFAENAGLSRTPFKFIFYMALLLASSASFVDSPPKMSFILKLYVLSFAWFGVQGLPRGLVAWHSLLANEDSFGPLMVVAMPFAYFFGLATSSKRWRWVAHAIFAVSVLGLVASFARGAAIAGAAVLLYIVLLSPNKVRNITYLILAAIILLPVVNLIVPLGAYLKEIGTSAGGDVTRTQLWSLAWRVFQSSPVYGVGASNYGVAAMRIASPMEQSQMWGSLYYRAVHNTSLQILAEEGLIGIALWVTMIVSFFRWNFRLRKASARASWVSQGGTDLDLRLIARGLDGSMLGFLLSGIFYNQLYIHWFWSLVTISYVLVRITNPVPTRRVQGAARRRSPLLASLQRR
jgi:O-antigen ligase